MGGMKRQVYRRCLVCAICVSLSLVVLPIAATIFYYIASLKEGFHPDGGLANLIVAAQETHPLATIALWLVALGGCVFPLSVILLAANIIAGRLAHRHAPMSASNPAPKSGG